MLLAIAFGLAACTQEDAGDGATVNPDGPLTSFGPGVWIVGVDIEPGTYRSSGGGPFCIWERLSGFGRSSNETIVGEVAIYGEIQTVTIMADDAGFSAEPACGTWSPAPTMGPKATEFGPGVWMIGVDIAPGRYRSSGEGCFWGRLSGFGGTPSESVGSSINDGIQTVDIAATDVGFSSLDGCGSWSPAPTFGPRATDFGPGVWVVGLDIVPGTYRYSGGDDCFWARLSAFDGSFDAMIDVGGGEPSQPVTIDATDAGFAADTFCGMWSLDPAFQS